MSIYLTEPQGTWPHFDGADNIDVHSANDLEIGSLDRDFSSQRSGPRNLKNPKCSHTVNMNVIEGEAANSWDCKNCIDKSGRIDNTRVTRMCLTSWSQY